MRRTPRYWERVFRLHFDIQPDHDLPGSARWISHKEARAFVCMVEDAATERTLDAVLRECRKTYQGGIVLRRIEGIIEGLRRGA